VVDIKSDVPQSVTFFCTHELGKRRYWDVLEPEDVAGEVEKYFGAALGGIVTGVTEGKLPSFACESAGGLTCVQQRGNGAWRCELREDSREDDVVKGAFVGA